MKTEYGIVWMVIISPHFLYLTKAETFARKQKIQKNMLLTNTFLPIIELHSMGLITRKISET